MVRHVTGGRSLSVQTPNGRFDVLRREVLGLNVTKDEVVELNMIGEDSTSSAGRGADLTDASSSLSASASSLVLL